MAARQAIRGEGQGAESEFLRLVPHSRRSANAKRGDVVVHVDQADHYVEVKECHAAEGAAGTINQVRAIKFITCVVWAPNQRCWYVLSPDQLVRLASTKSRGQHTEIPFESMNFNLASLAPEYHSRAGDDELADTVHAAIRRGVAFADLRDLMNSLLAEITELRRRFIQAVRDLDQQH